MWVKEQQAQRIRDYANLMTDTHGRAKKIYDEAETTTAELRRDLGQGRYPEAEELAEAKDAYLLVAKKSREEKEALGRVVPPEEALSLQKDGVDFLEKRAVHAETIARFYELAEKGTRGDADFSQSEIDAVLNRGDKERKELKQMAKDMANKKDELMLR